MPKDQLNLTQVKELVKTSTLRNIFTLGLRTAQGGGGGIGASALIVAIITVAGVSAAFAIDLIAALSGAVIFAALALGLSYYQLWKTEQKLKSLKDTLDSKTVALNNALLDAIYNFQLLHENGDKVSAEILRLKELRDVVDYPEERTHIDETIESLQHDLVGLKGAKTELLERLKVMLSVVQGNNNTDKLYSLFKEVSGRENEEAVSSFANYFSRYKENELPKIKAGLKSIALSLNEPAHDSNYRYTQELEDATAFQKPKTHGVVKWLTTGLAGFGGLLGGAGTVITVSAIVLGGMAAVTGVGWPIAVAAIGFGLITAAIAIYAQRRIEHRQLKVLTKMNMATAQVSGMVDYVENRINKPTTAKIKAADQKYQDACNNIRIRLDEHRKSFKGYELETNTHTDKIRSLISEVKKFRVFLPSQLESVRKLKKLIKTDIVLLTALRGQVSKVAIVAGSEIEKNNLLLDIDKLLKEAEQDLTDAKVLIGEIDVKMHQSLEHQASLGKNEAPSVAKKLEKTSSQSKVENPASELPDDQEIHPHSSTDSNS